MMTDKGPPTLDNCYLLVSQEDAPTVVLAEPGLEGYGSVRCAGVGSGFAVDYATLQRCATEQLNVPVKLPAVGWMVVFGLNEPDEEVGDRVRAVIREAAAPVVAIGGQKLAKVELALAKAQAIVRGEVEADHDFRRPYGFRGHVFYCQARLV